MTPRERVIAALRGEMVDRVPISFWGHDYAAENSAVGLAEHTLRLARTFGWDYLKPQSRAQAFAEMWGLTYKPSGKRSVPYSVTHYPIEGADELGRLAPADPSSGALGEQLEALRAIREGVGPDVPIVWTVFSPLMVLEYLFAGGKTTLLELLRADPEAVRRGLDAVTETLAGYTQACLAQGADGVFFATNLASQGLLTAAECRTFQRPFDLRVLDAASGGPFNILHLCGTGILLDEFADYPVQALSWSVEPDNPGLFEMHRRTGRAVLAGLPRALDTLTPSEVAERVGAAVEAMQSRWLLIAPGCSIRPSTPPAALEAARAAVG